jgi:hypothetical protein
MKNIICVLFISISFSCNYIQSTKDKVIGKWKLTSPIEVSDYHKITTYEIEFTENNNSFAKVEFELGGEKNSTTSNLKYEVDGEKVILENGTVYSYLGEGFLTSTNQTLLGTIIIKLEKVVK